MFDCAHPQVKGLEQQLDEVNDSIAARMREVSKQQDLNAYNADLYVHYGPQSATGTDEHAHQEDFLIPNLASTAPTVRRWRRRRSSRLRTAATWTCAT